MSATVRREPGPTWMAATQGQNIKLSEGISVFGLLILGTDQTSNAEMTACSEILSLCRRRSRIQEEKQNHHLQPADKRSCCDVCGPNMFR